MWRARTILDELKKHRPNLASALEPIFASLGTGAQAETLARLFPLLERVPIDKAVMEHAPNVRVLEVPYVWNDVGDWRALATLLQRDPSGNAIQGQASSLATRPTRSSFPRTAGWSQHWESTTWSSSIRAKQPWSQGKTSSTS